MCVLYFVCFVNLGTVIKHLVCVIMHSYVIVLLSLACLCTATTFTEDDDVLVLTKDSFDTAVSEITDILVEFCTFANLL